MSKPYANIADLLLPARKLWDGAYGVALANTERGQRGDRPAIRGPEDVLRLGEHAAILEGAFAVTPDDRANVDDEDITRVRELVDVAGRIAEAGLQRQHPAAKVVERLAPFVEDAFAALRFRRDGKGYTLALDARGSERVLHLGALSLGDLLISTAFVRIRRCAFEDCAYVFVDRSPGVQRLYCDRKTCGSAVKTKRKTARRRRAQQRFEARKGQRDVQERGDPSENLRKLLERLDSEDGSA